MNDDNLLELNPCQLAKKYIDDIKLAIKLGYNLKRICNSDKDGLSHNCLCNPNYITPDGTTIIEYNLARCIWKHLFSHLTASQHPYSGHIRVQKMIIDYLVVIKEAYDGKIIFLSMYDHMIPFYHNLGYTIFGFHRNVYSCGASGKLQYCMILLQYIVNNQLIDYSSALCRKIERNLEDEYARLQFDTYTDYEYMKKIINLKLLIHNSRQRENHYSLSSLLLKTIDLEKEDLSAYYYY
jgi:hypothetical protein